MEIKEIQEVIENASKAIKEKAEGAATQAADALEKAKSLLDDMGKKASTEDLEKAKSELEEKIKGLQTQADKLSAKVNSPEFKKEQKEKSFNENLADTIEENADAIKGYKSGQDIRFEMKAVGDMSITANFPNATPFIQDVRSGLIVNPYDRVWLADILPQGASTGNSIIYPKENGGEGSAGLWSPASNVDKPQMDFDLTSQTAFFKWIAGHVIVDREMLDDIAWLTSYIQNKMLISLKTAENAFVLNGSSDTNPVTGMLAAATEYDGTYTAAVDRIIDAGWGQIVEDTEDFYSPTHTILTPRDSVAIGLNKAEGSGEYDLPAGSVAFANGQLQIGGITGVKTTQIGTGNFLTFDRSALMFVRRMQPELRMFEDAALAKRNKLMFRIEERATLAIFNNNALVKGTLAPVTP
ncbi:phage major capsid protein [Olivibacter sp. LS-1]|uniref:phage major capsid protein n=1 Tax=Olivibacter sp. LS-1 TaxID=2592345 RepID=UPI0011EA78F2|nr:phage major capsid protein [Olivibacter sp. LS-1]QEL01133.1 phage major capsid protein [Olivibacter sp. LS-1]